MGKHIGNLYKELKGKTGGAPFNCYYDEGYKEIADIELCVPYHGTITSNKVTIKSLSAINALSTVHMGGYGTLNLAYKAIIDYAKKEGYMCKLPSREVYIKGPGKIFKGNPEKYVTEILVPIDKAE